MRSTLYNFIVSFLIVAFLLFNFLGLQTSSNNHNEELILDITAPSFDINHNYSVVILIDSETLKKYEISYPLSYSKLSQILRVISNYDPKMVMIDILQNFKHPNSNESSIWLERLQKSSKKHPIFLADNTVNKNEYSLFRNELNKNTIASPVTFFGPSNRYPLKIESNEGSVPTTALLMYKKNCEIEKKPCYGLFENDELFTLPMIVRWNADQHPNQKLHFEIPEQCNNLTSIKHIINFFSKRVSYSLKTNDDRENLRNQCFPILTVSAKEVLALSAFESNVLEDAIRGKNVFLGYDIDGVNDKYFSPVHGQLPGVFYHAMALMNLHISSSGYWKSPSTIDGFNISIIDIIQSIVYLITLVLAGEIRDDKIRISLGGRVSYKKNNVLVFLIFSTLIIPIFYSVFINNLGFINWFAFITVVLASIGIVFQSRIIERIKLNLNISK